MKRESAGLRVRLMYEVHLQQIMGHTMEQETEKLRRCKRCLLREMTEQEEYFHSLRDYIENIDPDIRATEPLYEERLAICRSCGMLMQGMCRKCGCYVELRAAVAKNTCPRGEWDG